VYVQYGQRNDLQIRLGVFCAVKGSKVEQLSRGIFKCKVFIQ
jgi:hypothetical protein